MWSEKYKFWYFVYLMMMRNTILVVQLHVNGDVEFYKYWFERVDSEAR